MNNKKFPCYNCKTENKLGALFCKNCNSIQPATETNYFRILNLDPNFEINLKTLEDNYLNLQTSLHPDQFKQKSDIEQSLALKHSSILNEAYDIIKSNRKRSEYLLKLQNIIVNQDNKTSIQPDPELLHEIFEIRDQIDETSDTESLNKLNSNIENSINSITSQLAKLFKKQDFEIAAKLTIKLRYFEKISEELSLKTSS